MALDQKSKDDLLVICDHGLTMLEIECDKHEREDVFYVPILVVAAIRHLDDGTFEVMGADAAFDDRQPRDGIASVLSTVVEVLRGNQPATAVTSNVIGANLS